VGIPQSRELRDSVLDTYVGCHKCSHNVVESLHERLIGESPQPTEKGKRVYNLGINLLRDKFKKFNLEPLSYGQVVKTYSGQKRSRYLNAAETILNGRYSMRQITKVNAFIKKEKLPIGKPTRVIQSRSPVYNLLLGRYTKALEPYVFGIKTPKCIGGVGKMFAAGLDDYDKAKLIKQKWDNLSDPVVISMDYSRYDKCVRPYQLKGEHSLYLNAFHNKSELQSLLARQIHNRGVDYSSNVFYKVKGTRCTGEMNTLIGNSLVNSAMLIGILKKFKIKGDLLIVGDDSLIFLNRWDLNKTLRLLKEYIPQMGHSLVATTHYVLQTIKFCSSNPIFTDDNKWRMIKIPSKCYPVMDSHQNTITILVDWES